MPTADDGCARMCSTPRGGLPLSDRRTRGGLPLSDRRTRGGLPLIDRRTRRPPGSEALDGAASCPSGSAHAPSRDTLVVVSGRVLAGTLAALLVVAVGGVAVLMATHTAGDTESVWLE